MCHRKVQEPRNLIWRWRSFFSYFFKRYLRITHRFMSYRRCSPIWHKLTGLWRSYRMTEPAQSSSGNESCSRALTIASLSSTLTSSLNNDRAAKSSLRYHKCSCIFFSATPASFHSQVLFTGADAAWGAANQKLAKHCADEQTNSVQWVQLMLAHFKFMTKPKDFEAVNTFRHPLCSVIGIRRTKCSILDFSQGRKCQPCKLSVVILRLDILQVSS